MKMPNRIVGPRRWRATLDAAIDHSVQLQGLVLTQRQRADLVEYLTTL